MAQGSKQKYTDKQKRQAEHIAGSARKRGASAKRAKQIGWATVNKQDGGGNKSGSGRGHKKDTSPSKQGGKKGGARSGGKSGTRGGTKAQHAKAGRAAHRK
jgi:hypothetical protein